MAGGDPDRPRGIDVSKWQTTTPSLVGKAFLIARASIGLTPDTRYAQHIAAARKAGVITGAYHFNWREISPVEQAHYFLDRAGNVDLYALDVEGEHAFTRAQTETFIDAVHARGKTVGLYHSRSGYFDAGQDWRWVAYWPIDKDTAPGIAWDVWQYGSDPTYKPTIIDGNVARDDATLARIAGKDDDIMRWLAIPDRDSICDLPAGTILYVDSSLRPDKANVTLTAPLAGARYIGYAGDIGCVGYDRSPDIAGMSGLWCKRSAITNIREVPPRIIPAPPQTYGVTVGGKDAGSVTLP